MFLAFEIENSMFVVTIDRFVYFKDGKKISFYDAKDREYCVAFNTEYDAWMVYNDLKNYHSTDLRNYLCQVTSNIIEVY